MIITRAEIPDVLIIEPKVFEDERGFFFESFNQRVFEEKTGLKARFVQDNHSRSVKNVLRGLHYQIRQPQGKLVRVTAGEIFDIAVDIRKSSPTFAKWTANILSVANKRMLWIPPGFAHGFLVISDCSEMIYKTTSYWNSEYERCILWNDPNLGIPWPLQCPPLQSVRDCNGQLFSNVELFD